MQEKYYIAFSCDKKTRHNSSSGGFIKEALAYLLRERIVEGALVVRQNYPYFFSDILETPQELDQMQGSVYAPVDFESGIAKMENGKKYAVVGIPCQLHKLFKKKPYLTIGLFCSGTPCWQGTEFFLKRYKIKDVLNIKYRGRGWPGKIEIKTKDKTYCFDRRISLLSPKLRCVYLAAFKESFLQDKCLFCQDHSNKLADISVGDAWSEAGKDSQGSNFLIVRTEKGQELVQELVKRNIIFVKEVASEVIFQFSKKKKPLFLKTKRKLAKSRFSFLLVPLVFFEEYIIKFPFGGIIRKIKNG